MFLSVELFQPPPNSVLTGRILQRQYGVDDLSSFNTNTN